MKPASDTNYERAFARSENMKPAYFEPISQKDKSYSHLTTRQYIVTQLASTQLRVDSMSDHQVHNVITTLEKIADRILKG